MRNFEERKAEVFRRSENRIKQRKRTHNRILALCIPLCMILTVWSVTIFPAILPANNKNMAAENTSDLAGEVDGSNGAYIQVEVVGIGNTLQSTILKEDANEITQIYYSIDSAFVSAGEGDKYSTGNNPVDAEVEENKENFTQSGTTALSSGYKITFTTGDGAQVVYTLNGYVLSDDTTKKSVTLTETQRSQILDKLGLVIIWEEEPK